MTTVPPGITRPPDDEAVLRADSAARERALAIASFIVEAPAGAGKTELLTQRVLRLLAGVQDPEEVLALTFTNKAATEMRDRILGSLARAAAGDPGNTPHQQRTLTLARAVLARDATNNWGLLDYPGRLRITTLDALCAGLARQMPFLSRFGRQPAVADDATPHYEEAARATLALLDDDSSDENPAADTVAEALARLDNDAGRLARLLVAMLGKRDQWLPHLLRENGLPARDEVDAAFAALIARQLAAAQRALDARWQTLLLPFIEFAAAHGAETLRPLADGAASLGADPADLPAWQAVAGWLLTAEGEVRKKLDKRNGFPPGAAFADTKSAMLDHLRQLAGEPARVAALAALADLPAPVASDAEWATVITFSRLLQIAASQLWLVFQAAGEVDFIEIAARARLALGDDDAPTDLAQALDYRIHHLLVDEFQDTSPTQVALLEQLVRGWTPGDGHTLFLVGDPMQSIYRFRKADVGLFLQVRARGIGGVPLEHLRLSRNNRSDPAVVAWVNALFPALFPATDDPAAGAVRYAPCVATRPDEARAAVHFHPILAAGQAGDVAEARQILALIDAAQRDDPAGRIAILVRARTHLDTLAGLLRRERPNQRFQAVDIDALAGRQVIEDLLSLAGALTHRADRVRWLAVLRAPWCGLTLADLHALVAGDKTATVWQLMHDPARLATLSDDGRNRLRHVRDILGLALAEQARRPWRRWLEGTWLMLDGPRCLEQPGDLADVQAFFALVDRLATRGPLDPDQLAAAAADLYAPPDPLGGAVQMMTIHKSKGLEFETVILPGLHRPPRHQDAPLLAWDEVIGDEGHEHLLVAPMKPRGDDRPARIDLLRALEATRAGHEAERLLYVAATRAIRTLHLLGVAAPGSNEEITAPAAGSFLARLWAPLGRAAFASAAGSSPPSSPAAGPVAATFAPPLRRLRQLALPPELRLPAPLVGSLIEPPPQPATDDAPPTLSPTPSLEAAVGTLVHRCLELIVKNGPDFGLTVAGRETAFRRWLAARGFSPAAAAEGARDALAVLATTLGSPTGQWLLAPHPGGGAEEAWCRIEADGTARQHIIDRAFLADGCRWIVDYKTVRAEAAALPALAERFRPQLARYASLYSDRPEPLRLAIWFARQGVLHELPPPGAAPPAMPMDGPGARVEQ